MRWRRVWWLWRIMTMRDRFGLGWRAKLALGILSNLDRIDIVEVIADDYFRAPRRRTPSYRSQRTRRERCVGGFSRRTTLAARRVYSDHRRLQQVLFVLYSSVLTRA